MKKQAHLDAGSLLVVVCERTRKSSLKCVVVMVIYISISAQFRISVYIFVITIRLLFVCTAEIAFNIIV